MTLAHSSLSMFCILGAIYIVGIVSLWPDINCKFVLVFHLSLYLLWFFNSVLGYEMTCNGIRYSDILEEEMVYFSYGAGVNVLLWP